MTDAKSKPKVPKECPACFGTGKHHAFKCPTCGSPNFGSVLEGDSVKLIRHCHGPDCNFSWESTKDETVFRAVDGKCPWCQGSGLNKPSVAMKYET